jgi:hypothetical protein
MDHPFSARWRRASYSLTTLALCWLAAQPLAAQARVALSWVREAGAESCIGAQDLGRAVERIVGPVLVAAPQAQLSVEGRIAPRDAGFHAEIVLCDGKGRSIGRRQLQTSSADCRAFDEQLAFVIAVTIDPDAALAQLPGEFATLGEPGAELLAELRAQPPRAAPMSSTSNAAVRAAPLERREASGVPLHWTLAAGPALGIAVLASVNVGARAEIGLITGSWSHHLDATVWLARAKAAGEGAQVVLSMMQLGFATCPQLWASSMLAIAGCGGVTAAPISAVPQGFAGKSQTRWVVGPTLEARLRFQITAWAAISFGLGAQSLWPRHRFAYENSGNAHEVYRVPPAMGFSHLVFELRF